MSPPLLRLAWFLGPPPRTPLLQPWAKREPNAGAF